jgi:hypothetical protein
MKAYILAQLDKLGIFASSLCALHCLVFPILLPLIPVLGLTSYMDTETHHIIDNVTILASVVLGFLALLSGFQKYHRKLYPFYALAIAVVIYSQRHTFGETYEPFVIASGALVVLLAHFINVNLCRNCKNCEGQGHQH